MPKKILLIRHAIPDDSLLVADEKRPITQLGKQIQTKMAHLMIQQGHIIDQLFHSPAERTKMTASILAEIFHVPAIEDELLGLTGNEQLLYEKIVQHDAAAIALVGHAPSLFQLTRLLIPDNPPQFHLERSGVLIITPQDENNWEYISPKQVM